MVVRNMNKTSTADDLRAEVEKFGDINDIHMPKDFYSASLPLPVHISNNLPS